MPQIIVLGRIVVVPTDDQTAGAGTGRPATQVKSADRNLRPVADVARTPHTGAHRAGGDVQVVRAQIARIAGAGVVREVTVDAEADRVRHHVLSRVLIDVLGGRHVVGADVDARVVILAPGGPQVGLVVVHRDVGQRADRRVGLAAERRVRQVAVVVAARSVDAGGALLEHVARVVVLVAVRAVVIDRVAIEILAPIAIPVAVGRHDREVLLARVLDRVRVVLLIDHPVVERGFAGQPGVILTHPRERLPQRRTVGGWQRIERRVESRLLRRREVSDRHEQVGIQRAERVRVDRHEADPVAAGQRIERQADRALGHLDPDVVVRVPVGDVRHLLGVGAGRRRGAVGPGHAARVRRCAGDDVVAIEIPEARVLVAEPLVVFLLALGLRRAAPGHHGRSRNRAEAVLVGRGEAVADRRGLGISRVPDCRQNAGRQIRVGAVLGWCDPVVKRVAAPNGGILVGPRKHIDRC